MGRNLDELARRYIAGEPLADIARLAGVAAPTLVNRLRRAGVPSRRRTRRDHALEELRNLEAPETADALAERYGVTPGTIRTWAARAGIPLVTPRRPRSPRALLPLPPEIVDRYLAGERTARLAAELGLTSWALRCRLRRRGITRPPRPEPTCARCGQPCTRRATLCRSCRRRHPPASPRPCEGCGLIFIPPAAKLARGAGRFHSYACWNNWRRGRPQEQWRQ
jgi:hypothetical protein